MRHALWILVLLAAACGRDGALEATGSESASAATPDPAMTTVLSRDPRRVQVTRGPKGARADLKGGFQSAAVIRRAADGTLQTECFDEAAQARAFLQGTSGSTHPVAEVQ
jgi:hypothetical protein